MERKEARYGRGMRSLPVRVLCVRACVCGCVGVWVCMCVCACMHGGLPVNGGKVLSGGGVSRAYLHTVT